MDSTNSNVVEDFMLCNASVVVSGVSIFLICFWMSWYPVEVARNF